MTCAARWCGSPTRSSRRTRRTRPATAPVLRSSGSTERGAVLAQRLHTLTSDLTDAEIPFGTVDISFYRDDLGRGDRGAGVDLSSTRPSSSFRSTTARS